VETAGEALQSIACGDGKFTKLHKGFLTRVPADAFFFHGRSDSFHGDHSTAPTWLALLPARTSAGCPAQP